MEKELKIICPCCGESVTINVSTSPPPSVSDEKQVLKELNIELG
jgi:hypothetical protein